MVSYNQKMLNVSIWLYIWKRIKIIKHLYNLKEESCYNYNTYELLIILLTYYYLLNKNKIYVFVTKL